MTEKEAKAKLCAVRIKEREYRLAEEKTNRFRETVYLSSSVPNAAKTERSGNSTEKKYETIIDYDRNTNKKFRKYILARQDAELLISSIRYFDEREVLTRHYIMFDRWVYIASKMHLSESRIYKLHEKALKDIAESVQ